MDDVIHKRITKTPGVCGGRACVAGHRVRVMDVVVLRERHGLSPEEIVFQYPGLTPADVHAALAYYSDNRDEIQEEFREDEQWARFAEANYPSRLRDRPRG